MFGEPPVQIIRKEIYNPEIEDYDKEEIPTETIKKFRRRTGNSPAAVLASYTGLGNNLRESGGSFDAIGRCLRMHLVADRATEFFLVDRGGTFDNVFLPASGFESLLGAPSKPLYNIKGTFKVVVGSVAAGTYSASFELMKRIEGTMTIR